MGRQAVEELHRGPGDSPLQDVIDTIARHGFDPAAEVRGHCVAVALRSCPFEAGAIADPELVCGIHRGMVEGITEQTHGAVSFEALVARDPTTTPCLLRLRVNEKEETVCDHCGCRSFASIAELTEEHEEILALAWRLSEGRRAREPWDEAAAAELLALLDVHGVKEETGLYPQLLRSGGLSSGVCDELEAEHRQLRVDLLQHRFDRRAFYALASHIEVEEMELFSAAMLGFDEEEWEAIEAAQHAAEQTAGASRRAPRPADLVTVTTRHADTSSTTSQSAGPRIWRAAGKRSVSSRKM